MPWSPFNGVNIQKGEISEATKLPLDLARPSLHTVNTIVTSAEKFSKSVGGIELKNLYPYQKYKIRVAARNTLGVGRFSSDVLVSLILCYNYRQINTVIQKFFFVS